jgi:hypothetical protein
MKKLFLSMGAIAGLAVSALSLTACNNAATEAKLKDANGNEVVIAKTEKAEDVAKALVVISQQDGKKIYAVGANLDVNAKVKGKAMGANVELTASASAEAKVTIGKNTYTDYTEALKTGLSEEQEQAAINQFANNIDFEASASANAKLKASVDKSELATQLGITDQTAIDEAASNIETMLNMEANGNAKLFYDEGYGYVEASAKLPTSLASMMGVSVTGEETTAELKKNFRTSDTLAESIEGNEAAQISTYLNAYQTKSLNELLASFGISGDASIDDEELVSVSTTAEDFYESEMFTQIVEGIKSVGVTISSVNGTDVEFTLNANGKLLNEAYDKFAPRKVRSINALSAIGGSLETEEESPLFDENTVYATAKCVIDVANVLPKSLELSTEKLGDIAKVAMGMSGAQLPVEFTEGNLSIALNFKYDDAVKFEMKKNASITYEFDDSELRK